MTKTLCGSLVLAALGGCVTEDLADPTLGSVETAIAKVPAGVQCIHIAAVGATLEERWFPVAADQSTASLTIGRLDPGMQVLTGEAYDVACPTDAAGADPTWIADPTTIDVVAGGVTEASLLFRSVTAVDTSVSFQPTIVQIATSDTASYALLDDGRVMFWGFHTIGLSSPRPIMLPGFRRITQISAGGLQLCGIDEDGALWCSGMSTPNQIPGVTDYGALPVAVTGLNGKATKVSVGATHTCAITQDESLYCWGDNSSGQVTGYSGPAVTTPYRRYTLPFVDVSAGRGTTAVLDRYARSDAWGLAVPTFVTLGTEVHAGDGDVCVVRADGSVWCTNRQQTVPQERVELRGAASLELATYGGCALLYGVPFCWGELVGDGTLTTSTGAYLWGLTDIVQISRCRSSGLHTCALRENSEVYCWGYSPDGALGDGTSSPRATPTRVTF